MKFYFIQTKDEALKKKEEAIRIEKLDDICKSGLHTEFVLKRIKSRLSKLVTNGENTYRCINCDEPLQISPWHVEFSTTMENKTGNYQIYFRLNYEALKKMR